MLYQVSDPEAATYAIDAAVCFWASLAAGNYAQAAMDAVSVFGWVKLALA